jgi:hypothetical protein
MSIHALKRRFQALLLPAKVPTGAAIHESA